MQVVSPNVYNFDLWRTSGHADHYRENMFGFDVEKQEFGLKPMNCPGVQLRWQARSLVRACASAAALGWPVAAAPRA